MKAAGFEPSSPAGCFLGEGGLFSSGLSWAGERGEEGWMIGSIMFVEKE